jgi:putative transposase
MTRPHRFFLEGVPVHVVQRGVDRGDVFFEPTDFARYHYWLAEAALEHGCAVHAYVLMTNHVHLLVTPEREGSLGRMMQSLGRRYVRYLNDRRGRTGTLWEGRYRASLVETERYFLNCCRYIELNPVRAGLVRRPGEWRWSSFPAHAEGLYDRALSSHPILDGLAAGDYAGLVAAALAADVVEAIRGALRAGLPLGDEAFRRRAGVPEAARPRGRPKIRL